MSTFTLLTAVPTAADYKAAAVYAQEYAATSGSNRTNVARTAMLVAAIATVIRTGKAVEVTTYRPLVDGNVDRKATPVQAFTGNSGTYHLAHRATGAGATAVDYAKVKPVAMVDVVEVKGKATGKASTTATNARVWLIPTGA